MNRKEKNHQIIKNISVVICTYNGYKSIELAIRSVFSGRYWPQEVIVVDNNSKEDFCIYLNGIIKKISEEYSFFIKVIKEKKQGLVFARQAAVETCQSKYVLFVDDDNEIGCDFIKNLSDIITTKEPDYIGCQTKLPKELEKVGEEFNLILDGYAIGSLYKQTGWLTNKSPCVWGAGLCVRVDSLKEIYIRFGPPILIGRVGTQMLAGDDSEICMRLCLTNKRGYFSDQLVLTHHISIERFTEKNALKMYNGFGQSLPTLKYYQKMIEGDKSKTNELGVIMRIAHVVYYFICYLCVAIIIRKNIKQKCLAEIYKGAFLRCLKTKWSKIVPRENTGIVQG